MNEKLKDFIGVTTYVKTENSAIDFDKKARYYLSDRIRSSNLTKDQCEFVLNMIAGLQILLFKDK
jgi:hypothetical protein